MESPKRTKRVPVNMSDSTFMALCECAIDDGRDPADMAHIILLRYLFGRIGAKAMAGKQSRSASQALGQPDFADTGFQIGS